MNSLFNLEMRDAWRGFIAVLTGNRDADSFFDLSMRGLAGSMVAFLIAATFNAYLPGLIGGDTEISTNAVQSPTATISLLLVGAVFIFQFGFGAMALNQFNRIDGLVPYLVVSNWATFFFTWAFAAMRLLDFTGLPLFLVLVVALIISEVNNLRLIVGLKPMQIAMFLVAQFVGALTALMLLAGVFPELLILPSSQAV